MKLSLVITTYNWPEALSLVIESIKNQTILPDEVIIADDGLTQETKDLFTRPHGTYLRLHTLYDLAVHYHPGFRSHKRSQKRIPPGSIVRYRRHVRLSTCDSSVNFIQ